MYRPVISSTAAAILLALSLNVSALEAYNPNQSYTGGTQVLYQGKIYEAQWWANAGDSPSNVTANSWESPWIFVRNADGDDVPEPENPDPENPDPETPDPEIPPVEGDFPFYKEGTSYKGGDVVQAGGQLYRCKLGVTSSWCSGAAWAYAPGSGTAWPDAWEKISEEDANKPPVDPEDPPTNPNPGPNPGPTPDPNDPYEILRSDLTKKEKDLTDFPLMQEVKNSVRTRPNSVVEQILPLSASNPENVKRVESLMSATDWDKVLFPKRAVEYTYRNFLQAVGKFPAFCGSYTDGRDSDAICRKSLATMFAHFAQETGGHTAHWDVPEWRQGLVHVREMGWNEGDRNGYNGECKATDLWQQQKWPCGTFENGDYKSYFGRGAKQLSYNFNYGPFSEAIFGDVNILLQNPEMVADTWLNLASAVFFFLYPQPPKPSMLHVIDGTWQPNDKDLASGLVPGFGVTTQIINGGVECGGSVEIAQSVNRISYYKSFANHFGVEVPADEVLGCKGMKAFDGIGAGALNIYWEQDWSWRPDTPGTGSYACQLVGYQTAYSAFTEGDYAKCVKNHFPNTVIVEDEQKK